jgi:hypothetical protein
VNEIEEDQNPRQHKSHSRRKTHDENATTFPSNKLDLHFGGLLLVACCSDVLYDVSFDIVVVESPKLTIPTFREAIRWFIYLI